MIIDISSQHKHAISAAQIPLELHIVFNCTLKVPSTSDDELMSCRINCEYECEYLLTIAKIADRCWLPRSAL